MKSTIVLFLLAMIIHACHELPHHSRGGHPIEARSDYEDNRMGSPKGIVDTTDVTDQTNAIDDVDVII